MGIARDKLPTATIVGQHSARVISPLMTKNGIIIDEDSAEYRYHDVTTFHHL
jgi:hypothetical protein